MNIAWVTPLVARSAIGRESVRITEALAARGATITLIGSEEEPPDEPLHPTRLPTLHWTEAALGCLTQEFDLTVVNVGDNFPFHAGIFPILAQASCVGIFHDFYVHNLFNGWLRSHGLGPADAENAMVSTYGEEFRPRAMSAARGELSLAQLAETFPMTEWLGRRCSGALVHANFYLPRLAASCPGPVEMARLPVASRGIATLKARRRAAIKVVTVGVMNPNKCAERVIAAIAASPTLRDRVEYRLVGPIDPCEAARLEGVAEAAGYTLLSMTGQVDDARLNEELTEADIMCCLRNPVLEGSSGSAIEGLLSGRPVIVADVGFYGELPDDVVFKVPSDVPIKALTEVIETLAADETLRRSTGARARAWAEGAFHIDQYVVRLHELFDATITTSPWLRTAAAIGEDLSELGLGSADPSIDRIGALLGGLVAPEA
jgi:glycosyltransferase involved in cell wall biosynthesis